MLPEDLDETLAAFARVSAEGLWLGTEAGFDREHRRQSWLAALADERARMLVVQQGEDGPVLGHGSVHVARYGVAELFMELVAEARGQGVGRRLLDALVADARELGAHKVQLQVWPHNEAALRLYLSRGFVVEGRIRAHYRRASGQAWDALVMGLLLEPELARRGSPLPDADCVPTSLDLREHGRVEAPDSGDAQSGADW